MCCRVSDVSDDQPFAGTPTPIDPGAVGAIVPVPILYPWDVLDAPSLVDDLHAIGARRVVLAGHYHAVRAGTPRHPRQRWVDAAHTASYTGRVVVVERLRSHLPTWTRPDAFLVALQELGSAGLEVDAWVTGSHADPAGARAPHRVVDAFGNSLRHALCPNDPVAGMFIDAVVDDVLQCRPAGVVGEAVGPLGFDHADLHDKTAGADWTQDQRRLLSICCCPHCAQLRAELGVDPDRLAAAIRGAILQDDPGVVTGVLEEFGAAVLQVRLAGTRARWTALLDSARRHGVGRVAVHATADRWATGPATPLEALAGADVLIGEAWTLGDDSVQRVDAVRAAAGGAGIGAHVTILPPIPPDPAVLQRFWAGLAGSGGLELYLYHAGLASRESFDAAVAAFAALSRDHPAGALQ